MSDIKLIIAKNIYNLRVNKKLTQLELAEMLHYSDKSVSKWEKGESLPEITTFAAMAKIFDVSLDYFIKEHNEEKTISENKLLKRIKIKNRALISGISIILVWLIATVIFVLLDALVESNIMPFLPYVFAIPATLIVWLVFNSVWFNKHRNFLIISLLMWSVLAVVFTVFLILNLNLWKIFLLGIPAQIIIALWSKLKILKK